MAVINSSPLYINSLYQPIFLRSFRQSRIFGGVIGVTAFGENEEAPTGADVNWMIKDVSPKGPGYGDTIQIDSMSALVAKQIPIGVDVNVIGQSPTFSKKTVTMNQWFGVPVTIDNATDFFQRPDIVKNIGMDAMEALAQQFEDSIIAIGQSFTQFGGGAGAALTIAELNRLRSKIELDGVPVRKTGDLLTVVSPYAAVTLRAGLEHQLYGGVAGTQLTQGRIVTPMYDQVIVCSARLGASGGATEGFTLGKESIQVALAFKPRMQTFNEPYKQTMTWDILYGLAKLRDEAGYALNYDDTNNLTSF